MSRNCVPALVGTSSLSPRVEDESPYPEVRSAVANTDDPTMPVGTLRAWILGLIWAIVIPGVNQFYFFRYPNVTIGPVSAALNSPYISLIHPIHSFQSSAARRSITLIPCRPADGTTITASTDIRCFTQSGAIFYQRARSGHHHGGRRSDVCVRSKCPTQYIVFVSDADR